METRTALTLSAYYHVLALLSNAIGLVIAGVALFVGLGSALSAGVLTDPTSLISQLSLSGVAIAAGGLFVGLYIRRVGKTAAHLKVQTEAVERNVDVPSTSVISRKVGREVSTEVAETITDAAPDSGFEFDDAGAGDADSAGATESAQTSVGMDSTADR